MQMRKMMIAFAVTAVLGTGTAFGQSQQGGYLGVNPGAHQTASTVAPSATGSGQGGYLGQNLGAGLTAGQRGAPSLADELADASAWCRMSRDPDHCRGNAAGDHKICVADPQHYDSCRYAMSQMFHN
jgi:hypothetical protein